MAKHKGKKKMNIDIADLIVTLVKSNMIGYALTAIFVIFAAILLTYTNLAEGFEKWIVLLGVIASSGLVGSDTAKTQGKQGYKWGAVGGASYLLIFVILAFLLGGATGMSTGYVLTVAILTLISSSLAGIVTISTKK